jgi:hypothetical protein
MPTKRGLSDVTKAKACVILLFCYTALVLVALIIRFVRFGLRMG